MHREQMAKQRPSTRGKASFKDARNIEQAKKAAQMIRDLIPMIGSQKEIARLMRVTARSVTLWKAERVAIHRENYDFLKMIHEAHTKNRRILAQTQIL